MHPSVNVFDRFLLLVKFICIELCNSFTVELRFCVIDFVHTHSSTTSIHQCIVRKEKITWNKTFITVHFA